MANKQEVFRFTFQDMLQDLIHSAGRHIYQICPKGEEAIQEKEQSMSCGTLPG
jgi:hypothetical protein